MLKWQFSTLQSVDTAVATQRQGLRNSLKVLEKLFPHFLQGLECTEKWFWSWNVLEVGSERSIKVLEFNLILRKMLLSKVYCAGKLLCSYRARSFIISLCKYPSSWNFVVLCEYSKFWIESNSYFRIRFDLKRAQLFEIFKYLPSPISYLFNRMTPIFFTLATMPSNQQNLLTMVQVLYLLEVFILAHYGPPSTETPTTETTVMRCHKNSWICLTSTYYWWLLRPTITIWFDSKF